MADGRIRYREDILDGLERAPEPLIGMLGGRNVGKLIVRLENDNEHLQSDRQTGANRQPWNVPSPSSICGSVHRSAGGNSLRVMLP